MHPASSRRLTAAGRRICAAVLFTALAVVWAGPGCVFFVPSATGLETYGCHFQGGGSPCGLCATESCHAQVDACCVASDCEGLLSNLDSCAASGDMTGCENLTSDDLFSTSVAYNALVACISTSCANACVPGEAGAGDGGQPGSGISCDMVNGTCFCTFQEGQPPGTVSDCSANLSQLMLGSQPGICCADPNYPMNPNTSCTCSPFSCVIDESTGCDCSSNYDNSSSRSADTCAGQGCCVIGDGICNCGGGDAGGCDGVAVQECTAVNTGCLGNQVNVASCSNP